MEDFVLKDKNGNLIDIPVEGSLGLLAVGARGILAWKKKRKECNYQIKNQNIILNKNTDEKNNE
ncbi:MAG: hypothetical protein JXR48_09690 [Candidatus Delongbacteria bacterium]|nr:hypothetical protein [Candidatus Delongbacteria bacterium]MBN2835225.1 hypothetical protein [Candidatus Delongbacteria bacterium]